MENRIELKHVYKRYRKNLNRAKRTLGYLLRIPSVDDFWALEDVSLSVQPGHVLGIIGPNGAGKSTILKVLSRVTQPTSGTVTIHGKIGALIELGAGLNPELSGQENIFLYGSIMGMKRFEIEKKFNEIVEFSGLREFLMTPIKFYSTGMLVRLGFAITVFMDPDILLIDEVLAVGDLNFQRKCLEKVKELVMRGVAIVLVSHNFDSIKTYADEVILINAGKIIAAGNFPTVMSAYHANILSAAIPHPADQLMIHHGTGEVIIEKVTLLDEALHPVTKVGTGNSYVFRIHYTVQRPVPVLHFGIGFHGVDESYIIGTNTQMDNVNILAGLHGAHVDFHVPTCPLLAGNYYVNVETFGEHEQSPYDFVGKALYFTVETPLLYRGLFHLQHRWVVPKSA